MTLFVETLILALCMTLFSALPLLSARVRKHSRALFLLGTGAMFGICFFDLVPDVFEMGGRSSLVIMGIVWALYSGVHLLHLGHHDHGPDAGDLTLREVRHSHGFYLFLGSLVAHCFASGMLLTVSFGLSDRIAGTVFAALLAHKAYESLLLSSILVEQKRSSLFKNAVIAVYSLSLPLGAALTAFFQSAISPRIAVLISSIAVGTLLGCLIFDFLIPSFTQLRQQRYKFAWILAGLVLTQLVMRQL